ncbi:hypothetical protein CYMTET_54943 [Cymbomonas tetramitiformis]|uniref:Uncharacterized protein n=1 Tax=Cymbomonas tetramitiformis TaxID=36881 RepID=A0AAE0EP26_9CHLO|nr:hypothetical protein CYMTET_54943 [Cymbomonas tetramitiformis]
MDRAENEMVEVTVDTVTVPGGGDGGGGSGGGGGGARGGGGGGGGRGVPLSEVEPTAKPHRVMEHMPLGVHMSALTNVHANEAAPVGTLVDDTVQVVML